MLRRFVMLALSVSLLGFSTGCGGPGEINTIERSDRPANLRDGSGEKKVDPNTGTELPDGSFPAD